MQNDNAQEINCAMFQYMPYGWKYWHGTKFGSWQTNHVSPNFIPPMFYTTNVLYLYYTYMWLLILMLPMLNQSLFNNTAYSPL